MTLPAGNEVVPPEVSMTVATHVRVTPTLPADGQLTVIEVVLGFTIKVEFPELAEWLESPL